MIRYFACFDARSRRSLVCTIGLHFKLLIAMYKMLCGSGTVKFITRVRCIATEQARVCLTNAWIKLFIVYKLMVEGIKIKLFAIVNVLADSPRAFRGLGLGNTDINAFTGGWIACLQILVLKLLPCKRKCLAWKCRRLFPSLYQTNCKDLKITFAFTVTSLTKR